MAILSTNGTFSATDTVTSTKLNNIANAATFDDPVDETTLKKHTDGKLRVKDSGVGTTQIAPNAVTFSKLAIGVVSDSYISGGIISPNSGAPTTTIDATKVDCISSDGTQLFTVSADSLNVTANVNWASGTAPTLTDLSVHLWADYNAGSPRYLLDDATGSNIAGAKRRVASFLLDGSDHIIDFTSFALAGGGYEIRWNSGGILDDSGTAEVDSVITVSAPTGFNFLVSITAYHEASTNPTTLRIASGFLAATSATLGEIFLQASSNSLYSSTSGFVYTDTSAQVRKKISSNASAVTQIVNTGYIDERTF
jgi:hypothetical protein